MQGGSIHRLSHTWMRLPLSHGKVLWGWKGAGGWGEELRSSPHPPAPFQPSNRVFGAMFAQPPPQWHVRVRGRKVPVAVHAVAQDLAADRVAAGPEVLDRHVILRADPAVAVPVEEDLARNVRPVRR